MKWRFASWFCVALIGCIDRIDVPLKISDAPVIIEGRITDQPGPYEIKVSLPYDTQGQFSTHSVSGALVVISDDLGVRDTLVEASDNPGTYQTTHIQGTIGRTYTLDVRTNGLDYASDPEMLLPAGELDSLYFSLTSVSKQVNGSFQRIDGFNIYVDASGEPRTRWEFFGTYRIQTDPSQLEIGFPPAPPACANGCLCCICWVSEYESSPVLSNDDFRQPGAIKRQLVGFVPINPYTFFDKYYVRISQSRMSEKPFAFYKALRDQLENGSSLFQPPYQQFEGNVKSVGHGGKVIGVFSASAIVQRTLFIYQNDLPYDVPIVIPIGICTGFAPHSTNVQPDYW